MIVLEGVDASGKSTLAKVIAERFGWPIQPSEGPPHYKGEMNDRVHRYALQGPRVYDRHPCISQPIYGKMRSHHDAIDPWRIDAFYGSKPVIIYCDPGYRGLNGHVHKPNQYDSPEHLENLERNYQMLLAEYRSWAMYHATFIYRIGDDMTRLANTAYSHYYGYFDPFGDVEHFHRRFLLDYKGPPRPLPPDLREFRVKFLAEELCEYVDLPEARKQLIQSILIEHDDSDTPEEQKLDALVDLVYVALGTAQLHGYDFREAWRRVQEANMTKIRVKNKDESKRGSEYDVVKPVNFVPPDLSDLVAS